MACAGGLKGLCRRVRLFGIDLVGRAKTGDRGARSFEGGGKRGGAGGTLARDSLDPSGLEKTFCKGGTRGEIRRRAEIGEKNFWTRAGPAQDFIRPVAQFFK